MDVDAHVLNLCKKRRYLALCQSLFNLAPCLTPNTQTQLRKRLRKALKPLQAEETPKSPSNSSSGSSERRNVEIEKGVTLKKVAPSAFAEVVVLQKLLSVLEKNVAHHVTVPHSVPVFSLLPSIYL